MVVFRGRLSGNGFRVFERRKYQVADVFRLRGRGEWNESDINVEFGGTGEGRKWRWGRIESIATILSVVSVG